MRFSVPVLTLLILLVLGQQQVLQAPDLLAAKKAIFGHLPGSDHPAIVEAWANMREKLSVGEIEARIKKFINKEAPVETPERPETGSGSFDVVASSKYPDHSMRVKKTHPEELGLDTVDQYSGYLDVEKLGKHFFYWFFESRNDPKNDPVVLWLNGGPGCSSATGMLFELGPSSINATLQPVYNPYAWNNNASVIFLDQPVGVGYSYTTGEQVKDSFSAAKDVFVFLELFFQKFPHLVRNDFHIAGELYGGHYLPLFASEIINHADRLFNLTSIMIGNGITDAKIQYALYRPMGCGEGGYKPVLNEEQCDKLDREYPICREAADLCYRLNNVFTCVAANFACESLVLVYSETGLNPYDVRKKCVNGNLCYDEMSYIDDYLNQDFVKEVAGATVDKFESCSEDVGLGFFFSGDLAKPFQGFVAELLDKGIPVLLYAGDKDFICNWLGNHEWLDALEYSGSDVFSKKLLQPWYTAEGKLAGEVKNHEKFTFLRVYDAGHMVPFDQPEASLDMFNRWISGEYALGSK